jgi:hypothetical protein
MNAKEEPTYIHEEVSSEPWIKSKAAKLTAAIIGGVIILGGTFGAGLVVGAEAGHSVPGIGGFDRDGDHKFPDGQHPPRPGDRDGDGNKGQFNPNQTPSQQPSTQNG